MGKRIDHIFYTLILAVILIVSGGFYCAYEIDTKVDREDLNEYYRGVYRLLGRHASIWDKYIQANELEKAVLWNELDSIRIELNLKLTDPDILRGLVTEKNMFTKLK